MIGRPRLPRRWLVLAPGLLALALLPARAELSEPEHDPLAEHVQELLEKPIAAQGKLSIVFVLDGLRPDCVNATDTPNLFRLRQEGVNFVNGHAVFPTVTRVNSPSIATGFYPGRAGVVSNSIYMPGQSIRWPRSTPATGACCASSTRSARGELLFVESLGERLQAAGKTLAAVSSGSSGSALLLNHRAPEGSACWSTATSRTAAAGWPGRTRRTPPILARFGPPPPKSGPEGTLAPVDWTQDVLRDYVIPELKPDVVLNWITQPDGTHHSLRGGLAREPGDHPQRRPEHRPAAREAGGAGPGGADQHLRALGPRLRLGHLPGEPRALADRRRAQGHAAGRRRRASPSSTHVALLHVKERDPREDRGHRPAPAGAALDRRGVHRRPQARATASRSGRRAGLRRRHLLASS